MGRMALGPVDGAGGDFVAILHNTEHWWEAIGGSAVAIAAEDDGEIRRCAAADGSFAEAGVLPVAANNELLGSFRGAVHSVFDGERYRPGHTPDPPLPLPQSGPLQARLWRMTLALSLWHSIIQCCLCALSSLSLSLCPFSLPTLSLSLEEPSLYTAQSNQRRVVLSSWAMERRTRQ